MNHPNLVALGTLMATIGAITSGFGMNLIRSSSKIERSKPWYCRRRLLIGIALACLINTFLDCVAFAIMPLAIIAPIGGVTIVSSVLFARCGLSGETQRFTYTQAVCVAIIVCGVAGVAIFGPHPAPVVNVHQTVHRIHNDSFVIYQIITISALAIVYIAMCTRGGQWLNHTTLTVLCAVAGGMCSGIAQCLMKVLAVAIADYMLHRSLPFALFDFWLSMVELIVIALFLLHMLTTCLSNAPLIISSSLYQVCVIVFTITAGCAFYGTTETSISSIGLTSSASPLECSASSLASSSSPSTTATTTRNNRSAPRNTPETSPT